MIEKNLPNFLLTGHRSILIVDDSLEDRETYKGFLNQYKDCEFTFFEATDANEAFDMASSLNLDCILLDYELPDVDGLEILERFKNDMGRLYPPIIMITGRGNEHTAVDALKRGAMDYIVKSEITPASILRAVVNAVDRTESYHKIEDEKREKEAAEEELRRSEEKFRTLIEGVKDYAIFMVDPAGMIMNWNLGAQKIFGFPDTDTIGHHYRMLFPADVVRSGIVDKELEKLKNNESIETEGWMINTEGESLWATGVMSCVYDEFNNLKGYIKVLRDETLKRENEVRLKDALAARDEFLSIASHELKTPLTSMTFIIQLCKKMLEKSGAVVDAKNLLDKINEADSQVKRLSDLVDDLLDVSRINAEKIQIDVEAFDLKNFISETLKKYNHDLELAGVNVTTDLKGDFRVSLSRVRLDQVIANILSNVRKYAPNAPLSIRLHKQGDYAELSFEDSGNGILPENTDRIFRRFERVANSSEISGLGLGLYISRKLMELMGGSIGVRSHLGSGATFFIRIPVKSETNS